MTITYLYMTGTVRRISHISFISLISCFDVLYILSVLHFSFGKMTIVSFPISYTIANLFATFGLNSFFLYGCCGCGIFLFLSYPQKS
jgi:hypothetical protein